MQAAGYETEVIDGLDFSDQATAAVLGSPRREESGTGKFFKSPAEFPLKLEQGSGFDRTYSRYGIIPEVFRKKIAGAKPDIVLVSSGMTYWYGGVAEAAETVRTFHPDVPIIVGGIYASLLPEHCRSVTGAYTVEGEGAEGLKPLLEKLGFPVPGGPVPFEPLPDAHFFSQAAVVRLNEGCPFSCAYCASEDQCKVHPG